MAQVIKNLPADGGDRRDAGSIPGLGRSHGGGNGNPLQYACLGNPMDRGAWRATVPGVSKSQSGLSMPGTALYPRLWGLQLSLSGEARGLCVKAGDPRLPLSSVWLCQPLLSAPRSHSGMLPNPERCGQCC